MVRPEPNTSVEAAAVSLLHLLLCAGGRASERVGVSFLIYGIPF